MYANALGGPILLDDQRAVVQNTSIRQLSPLSAVLHPPVQSPVTGRPLVNLSLALNYSASGLALEGYRLTNIAIHLLAALALFGVLRRTFQRTALVGAEAAGPLALVCAMAWAVHPLNTEAVNYLTQRTETLMGLFVLVALYASIRAVDDDLPERWWGLAWVAAVCGVASKETALLAPLVILLWDRVFAFASLAAAWRARWRLYALAASSWLLFLYFARDLPFFRSDGFEEDVSRLTYLLNQGPMILQYLWLSIWPRDLVFDYGLPLPLTPAEAAPAVAVVALAGIAALVLLLRGSAPGFWGAWFFLTLAPASSVIPIPTEVGAERRMYLPLVAVIVLLGLGAAWLLRKAEPPLRARLAWAVSLALLVALSAGTIVRNFDYASGLRIWQTVLDRRPHARAHEHLSMYLRDLGRIDESIAHLRIAAPESKNARHALASALLEQGDTEEALEQFREFIRLAPDDGNILLAREELAGALMKTGDLAGAEEQLRAVIELNPNYTRARVGLASLLVEKQDLKGALSELETAVRQQPGHLTALLNLGYLQAQDGQLDAAIGTLRRALAVNPLEVGARQQLLTIHMQREEYAAVEEHARVLTAQTPDDPAAYNVLGLALAYQARYQPAREQFERALQIDPNFVDAERNLDALP